MNCNRQYCSSNSKNSNKAFLFYISFPKHWKLKVEKAAQITIRLNREKRVWEGEKNLPEFLCSFMFYVPDNSFAGNKDYTARDSRNSKPLSLVI